MPRRKVGDSDLTRREFLYLSGAGMAGLALAGSPTPGITEEKKPKYGGRFRIGEARASSGLDVHKNQQVIDFFNYLLMYNALTIMGPLPQVGMYPDLAKSWEISRDGREFIFSLREKVKFHHGKELDSGDVKYSIERVMNPATRSPRAFSYQWIDSIHPLDRYHIKIRLKEPFGPFLTTLTIQNCPIIPAGWEPTSMKPAPGTGPFVFKSFVPNETIEVTRFDQYWEIDEKTGNRLPYLDGIQVKKIIDPTVRWSAIRAGELDYAPDPPRKAAIEAMAKPVPGVVIIMPEPAGYQLIYFNVTKTPFNDKRVRQAIAYAIDKNDLIKGAQWGMAEPINNQPFLNRSRMYIPVEDRAPSLSKARQLLAEAGYPQGFKAEFLEASGLTFDLNNAEYVAGQLKKIGIDATLKVIDRAAWVKNMREGDYLVSVRSDSERLDPDDAYFMWLHSSEVGKNNYSRYANKELDALLEKGRTTWKWQDRVPIYRKVVEIIKEDLPVLYLTKGILPLVIRDYVRNFEGGAATWFAYYGGGMKKVWLDK